MLFSKNQLDLIQQRSIKLESQLNLFINDNNNNNNNDTIYRNYIRTPITLILYYMIKGLIIEGFKR